MRSTGAPAASSAQHGVGLGPEGQLGCRVQELNSGFGLENTPLPRRTLRHFHIPRVDVTQPEDACRSV
jgi:hypothetical protein